LKQLHRKGRPGFSSHADPDIPSHDLGYPEEGIRTLANVLDDSELEPVEPLIELEEPWDDIGILVFCAERRLGLSSFSISTDFRSFFFCWADARRLRLDFEDTFPLLGSGTVFEGSISTI
jgi:hypothetical protein